MSEIVLSHEKMRQEISQLFGVSRETVKSALKFRTQSDLARKIRAAAIQKGGVEVK